MLKMDVVMEEEGELEISGSSSTTTNEEDPGYSWNDFSPVDWGTFSGNDDFLGLIDSMMGNYYGNNEDHNGLAGWNHDLSSDSISTAMLSTTANTSTGSGGAADMSGEEEEEEEANHEGLKGLRVVHLLMAAAEALTGTTKSHDLARVILVRLKELVSPTAGTNMERLGAYFTDTLQGLLDGFSGNSHGKNSMAHRADRRQQHHPSDLLVAFQLLQDMSPYVKFGHFTANQAILEAAAGDRRIHIVDYDIMEGIQWASLMQALVSRKDSPPTPHLRITAISRAGGGTGRKSMGTIQETGRRLMAFAVSIGQPFSFSQCRLDSDENFRAASVKLVRGEALVVNCMLHLPHSPSQRSRESVASFLSGTCSLNPRLITLVEEEMGPMTDDGFVGQFVDSLHHYSAVFDSLEASFPSQSRARELVERVFLAPRIARTVGQAYRVNGKGGPERLRGGDRRSWAEWMGEMGFGSVGISFFNHCQAKLLLGLFNDGYKVEEESGNKLVLAWKSRRLLSASVWSSSLCPPATVRHHPPHSF